MRYSAWLIGCLAAAGLQLATAQTSSADAVAQAPIYTTRSGMQLPDDVDRWIAVGSTLGAEYSDEPFDPASPGLMGVVQMEPAAYDHFIAENEYADGTMFLLSFYMPQEKPEPALPGFVQGDLVRREIHVIDRQRFEQEGRAFFMFNADETVSLAPMPLGSDCFVCHTDHGALDGTFLQFYPLLGGHYQDP